MAKPQSTKAPAFQFYPKDFLCDEEQQLMSLAAAGAYIRLMSQCWLKGSLPTETVELARLCGATPGQMTKFWPPISKCFRQRADGRWIHPRLEKERKRQADYRKRQSDAAASRWHKPDASHCDALQSSSPSSSPSPISNPKNVRTPRAMTTLVTPPIQHRNVAHFSPLGDVPQFVHSELIRKVCNGGADEREADAQVRAFYKVVEFDFEGQVVGEEPPKFWRARFAEYVKPAPKAMSEAAAAVFATLGVKP